jgi:hypothetical protein
MVEQAVHSHPGKHPHGFPSSVLPLSAIATRAANGISLASSYLRDLAEQGVVQAFEHEPRGDVILDITIEGVRFQAFAASDPYVIRKDRGDWCQLGVASIHVAHRSGQNRNGGRWMVCKYNSMEGRIDLSQLSDAGKRTFAVAFGIPFGHAHQLGFHEMYAFYAAPVFASLVEWAKRRPRKFKAERGVSNYLGNWKSVVEAAIPAKPQRPRDMKTLG